MDEKSAELIAWAKRGKERALSLRNRGNLEKAATVLETVSKDLDAHLTSGSAGGADTTRKLQMELSDILGTRGGVLARDGKQDEALSCYEAGAVLEEKHGRDTYNLGNAIRYAITVRNTDPSDPALREKIRLVIKKLVAQTSGTNANRTDEWWAWADLGQLRLLEEDGPAGRAAYDRGRATGPSAGDYGTSLAVLREVAEALPKTADAVRGVMVEEIQHLEAHAP